MAHSTTTVIGPPATGKTTYLAGKDNPHIVGQVERALDKWGPDRVVVASLTKTAAVEITSRLRERGIQIHPDHVGTLHSICYRAIGSPPLVDTTLDDFNATYHEALTSQGTSTDRTTDDLNGDSPGDSVRADMDLLRVRRVDSSLWPQHVVRFAERWEGWKSATGTVDFVDMIERAMTITPQGPGGPCGAIFYDEAQDGSRLELELLQQWARYADHTVIVGDEDQALYSWRGASVRAFLEFSDHKIVLKQSHRLSRAVHATAQQWAEQIVERYPKEFAPTAREGSVERSDAMRTYPEDVLESVQHDLASGRSVMLLATCGYMLNPLLQILRDRAIPFANPFRVKRGDWNPLRLDRYRATPAARLLALSRMDSAAWGAQARPWTWGEVATWVDPLDARATLRGAKTRLKGIDAERKVQPVTFPDLETLFPSSALEPLIRGDVRWYLEHVLPAKRQALELPVRVVERHGVQTLLSDPRRGLIVGTVHSVKGGEADVVYLWPDLSPKAYEQYDTAATSDHVLRTFYVGLTRARERLVLCAPSSGRAVEWISCV